ncbi:MAG: transketolase C-terminal domain-containing protein, partial [Oscillospiraceae bacterium]
VELFKNINGQQQESPIFVNAITVKGKGFTPAEKNPGAFHGVSTFDFETVEDPDVAPDESFSVEFGKSILKLAYINKKICTITAAMKYGTGLQFFHKKLPDRFFDVGMAEQHAVTFATGLAKGGMLPVVCIYSTFLQRAYDQIIHDVCLQNANVLFVIDRAGLVPNDGETHQGIYDVAFLSQHSNLRIVCPSNYAELSYWLGQFTDVNNVGPRAIRLPRGKEKEVLAKLSVTKNEFDVIKNGSKTKTAIISYGAMVEEAILAQNALGDKKINVDVIKLNIINPLPCGFIDTVVGYKNVVFLEDSIENGSVAQKTAVKLLHENFGGKYIIKAMPTRGIDHATVEELRVQNGLDCESICKLIESGEKF